MATYQQKQQATIERLEAEIERLREWQEYAFEATKAITNLTVGGSEFFGKKIGEFYTADLPYCVTHVRKRMEDNHERMKDAARNLRHCREECGKLHSRQDRIRHEAREEALEEAAIGLEAKADVFKTVSPVSWDAFLFAAKAVRQYKSEQPSKVE